MPNPNVLSTPQAALVQQGQKFGIVCSDRSGFRDWAQLAEFFAAVAVCSHELLGNAREALLPEPLRNFRMWLSSGRTNREQDAYWERMDQAHGDPNRSGSIQLPAQLGSVVLQEHDDHLIIVNAQGRQPEWSADELIRLVCAILADTQTDKTTEGIFSPFLLKFAVDARRVQPVALAPKHELPERTPAPEAAAEESWEDRARRQLSIHLAEKGLLDG